MGVAAVVLGSFLLKTGPWVIPGDAAANLEGVHANALRIVNEYFYYSLLVAVIISSFQLLRDLFRLPRGAQHRAPSRA
jgi:TRAP-type C4-dicarboxylate transport system permease small subunit